MISILMSVYNEEKHWIKKAVDSILNQTYRDFELIIIHDNPVDNETFQYLKDFMKLDNRIKVFQNSQNLGLANSLNEAFKKSRGKYIARMDADDISLPNRFEKQIQYFEKNRYDLLISGLTKVDENEDIIEEYSFNNYNERYFKENIYYLPMTNHPTWLMKRKLFESNNGYRSFKTAQDYDFLLRTLDNEKKVGYLNQSVLLYRIRNSSIGGSNRLRQLLTADYIQKLHTERTKNKEDSFDEKDLEKKTEKSAKEIFKYSKSEITMKKATKKKRINENILLFILNYVIKI